MSECRWARVLGTSGHFEVSTDGCVREVRGEGIEPRVLKSYLQSGGPYVRVWLEGRHRLIHVLMLEAFIGPRPHRKQAAHLNHLKLDNRLENLAWLSPYETSLLYAGTRHKRNFLRDEEVAEIRASKEPAKMLAERYGVHPSTIAKQRSGRSRVRPRRYATDAEREEILSSDESGCSIARRLGLGEGAVCRMRREAAWRQPYEQRTFLLEEVEEIRRSGAGDEALARRCGSSTYGVKNIRQRRAHRDGIDTA